MKSTRNTRAFVVGFFILLGLVIFVITVLTLGGQRKTFQKSITVKAIFDDVNGLQKGNNVWFSGVKIGTIKKISFVGLAQVEVDMNIDEAARQYIRKNAKARISSEGLIGNRIVVIFPGATASAPIEDGEIIGADKVTNPDEMMNTFQANNQNLLTITNNFKIISQQIIDGKGTVGKILNDETMFNEFQSTLSLLKKSALNAQRLSDDVVAYTAKLDNKGTLAHDLVSDTTIIRTLKTTIAKMEEASIHATRIVDNLDVTSTNLNNSLKNTNTPAGMLLNDEKTASDIKQILITMKSATQKLDEDLEALQHNFLLRGYFKRKAKEEAKENPKP